MKTMLSFDDVLILPEYSEIKSRRDVNTSSFFLNKDFPLGGYNLRLPVISSNMDTVTNSVMARAMVENGGVGCLHRFCSIEDNIRMFVDCDPNKPWVSIGLGDKELERAEALYRVGANIFILDVAHGANSEVVKQVREFRKLLHHSARIIVGNFATASGIESFNYHLGSEVDAYKVGIGGGSACLTRVVTGCGVPTLASILDCASVGVDIIADGGIRNSGDFAKAMAAGASAVMLGGLLAGTDEAPGEFVNDSGYPISKYDNMKAYKKYRGSASLESYEVQGKVATHRTPEGASFLVPYKGPVRNVLQELESGLRSAMSYVGASTIVEFQENTSFIQVTNGGYLEGKAHGKK